METRTRIRKSATLFSTTAAAVLGLLLLAGSLAGGRGRAAVLAEAGGDPHFVAITVTADLPLSDTRPSAGLDRTVYFSNGVPGVITLTFEISGTPTLTLTGGAAFGRGERSYTSTAAAWTRAVTYPVAATSTSQFGVAYTAANTDGLQVQVAITYVRDVTAPVVAIVGPPTGCYTGTQLVVTGTASDGSGSGVGWVQVSTGTTWAEADGTGAWTHAWALPEADDEPYTLTARAADHLGILGVSGARAITVDTVAPTTTAPLDGGEWSPTSTLVFAWAPSSDGAGIAGYQVAITDGAAVMVEFVTGTAYTCTGATEGVAYAARIRARDGNGNTGSYGPWSDGITPDLTPPGVSTPSIVEGGQHLYAAGTHLYYTNTMLVGETFAVQGYSADDLSGVDRIQFSAALGEKPDDDTCGFTPWQSPSPPYTVEPTDAVGGVITATIHDAAGNTAIQTYTYELDGTPPSSLATAPAYAISGPVPVTWTASDAQSGVYSTTLWYSKETTGTWKWHATASQDSGTFDFDPPDGDGLYLFATVAADNVGNLETGPAVSETQTLYVTAGPESTVTWAPQYRNASPITVTWVATAPRGASLAEVCLWYRLDAGGWASTEMTGTAGSGVFTFTSVTADGTYYFATVAGDDKGRSESAPSGAGDASTIYDTDVSPVTGLAAAPGGWSRTNAFTLTWSNPADASGVARAYRSVDQEAPTGPYDGEQSAGLTQTANVTVTGQGIHTAWVWLEDNAGNSGYTVAQAVALRYDDVAPVSVTITATARISATQFTVSWSAHDETSGVVSYTVEYSRPAATSWQGWLTGTDALSGTFSAPESETDYILRVTAYDQAGNSAAATTTTWVGAFRVYLPLTLKSWVWWYQYDVYEPNNTRQEAYPIQPAHTYNDAYIWDVSDKTDYYSIEVSNSSVPIVIDLWNIPVGCDYDLYLYDSLTNPAPVESSNQYGNTSEHITYNNPSPGTYYVRVYLYSGQGSHQPYSLRVTYE